MSGGEFNIAPDLDASIAGGCDDLAGPGHLPGGACSATGIEATLGGGGNSVSGIEAAISGGQFNIAADPFSTVNGGCDNYVGPTSGAVA